MTYKDLVEQGYKYHDTKFTRRYTSRRISMDDRQVYDGKGSRSGYKYVITPYSCRYSYRDYYIKEEK